MSRCSVFIDINRFTIVTQYTSNYQRMANETKTTTTTTKKTNTKNANETATAEE